PTRRERAAQPPRARRRHPARRTRRRDDVLAVVGCRIAGSEAGQCRRARVAVPGLAGAHHHVERQGHRCEPQGEAQRTDVLLPQVPEERVRRPDARVLDVGAVADGARGVAERLPHGIDDESQQRAQQLLGDRCGAVVAMNPRTGAVYTLASSPTFDNNLILKPGGYAKVLKSKGACGDSSALLNRTTDGLFTPGSTFKMITAAAALDSGAFTPSSTFNDPGYCTEYGKQVKNALNPD